MKKTLRYKQIQGFARYLCREERAKSTIDAYMHNIQSFITWIGDGTVTKEAVVEWKKELSAKYSPATVNVKLASLNALFKYLGWEELHVKALRIQRRTYRDAGRDLTRKEYERLQNTAEKLGKRRLSLLMETIVSAGIRVSEVRFITVETARKGEAEIVLKGKIRTIMLPQKLRKKLLQYAADQKIVSGEIFVTGSGHGVSRKQIWFELKSLCKFAGIEAKKVYPHNFRHLFAKTFYRTTKDVVLLSDVLGHSSIETTRIYLISTGLEHARALNALGLVR